MDHCLSYEEFAQKICDNLSVIPSLREKKVYFQRYEVQEKKEQIMMELNGSFIGVSAEKLYQNYLSGVDITEICEMIRENYECISENITDIKVRMGKYSLAKEYLYIRCVNRWLWKEKLQDAIYHTIDDIALVLYMKVQEDKAQSSNIRITMRQAEEWNVDPESIYQEALLNTYFMSPPRLYPLEKVLLNPDYPGDNFMNLFYENESFLNPYGSCLSLESKQNGAIAIFLPGVAKRLADLAGDDLYLAFTSIHEVMIHRCGLGAVEGIREALVSTIQQETPREDFLSNEIYRYKRVTETFEVVK